MSDPPRTLRSRATGNQGKREELAKGGLSYTSHRILNISDKGDKSTIEIDEVSTESDNQSQPIGGRPVTPDLDPELRGSGLARAVETGDTLGTTPLSPVESNQPLVRSNTHSIEFNMPATASPSTLYLKEALRIIPEFDGFTIPFSTFIEGCEEAKALVGEEQEANLAKLVKSRLVGEARDTVSGQTFDSIEGLRKALESAYAPAKTLHQLQGELGAEFQREGDSVIKYANRIRAIQRQILQVKKISGEQDLNQAFKDQLEANCAECFKRGLKPKLERKVPDSKTLTEAVKAALIAEREEKARNDLRGTKNSEPAQICQLCRKMGHEAPVCPKNYSPPLRTQICQLCKKNGHEADTCLGRNKGTNFTCYRCHQPGHSFRQCPGTVGAVSRVNTISIVCQICFQSGHSALQCPSNPRSTKTPDVVCQVCLKTGHAADRCYKVLGYPTTQPQPQLLPFPLSQQQQQNISQPSNIPYCRYCRSWGHLINNCEKRAANNNRRQGNFQVPPTFNSNTEGPKASNQTLDQSIEQTLSELIPLP